jgi:hypothetical protein
MVTGQLQTQHDCKQRKKKTGTALFYFFLPKGRDNLRNDSDLAASIPSSREPNTSHLYSVRKTVITPLRKTSPFIPGTKQASENTRIFINKARDVPTLTRLSLSHKALNFTTIPHVYASQYQLTA